MPKYQVQLLGENFEVKNDSGDFENLGFYTTRSVKADNEEQAENVAIQLIKEDKELINCLNKESQLEPMLYLEAISRIPLWSKLGGTGYTFFPMEEAS